jgi:uncharacterized protein
MLMGQDVHQDSPLFRQMIAQNPDIEGLAEVTTDGVVIASLMPKDIDSERSEFLSAAVACGLAIATRLMRDVGKGYLKELFVKLADGWVVVMPAPRNDMLVAICNPRTNINSVWRDAFGGNNSSLSVVDPIFPPRPPGSLRAHAKPDYDDFDG